MAASGCARKTICGQWFGRHDEEISCFFSPASEAVPDGDFARLWLEVGGV
jgi:hypothetical protein